MRQAESRAGIAPATAGIAMLLQAFVLRMLFSADTNSVRWLGQPLGFECSVRARLGIPCPTCGLTRSIVLSLHGSFGEAWNIAPGGPLAVLGVLLMGSALVFCGLGRRQGAFKWIRTAALAYAGAASVIWLGAWIAAVARAL